jgi:membrane protease YdiL (CAAX protease family)
MHDNDSKGISFTAGFFMLIAFTVAGVILASIIYYPIWTAMTGRPITEMEKDLSNPAYGDAAKIFQTITAIFGFFLPAFVTAAILNRKPLKLLGYSGNIKISLFGWVVLIMFASVIVSSSLSYFNNIIPLPENWKTMFTKWENSYNDQVTAIIGLNNFGQYILALVIMAFLPALCEETLFRGGLQNFLTRSIKMPLLSIIITSIIFSAIHLSWYGFLSRFFLGFILGYIYHYSGKIWLNIFAHFLNNALAITVLFVYKTQGKPVKELIADNGSWWGIIALPAVIALLLFFKRMLHGSAILTKRSNN